MHHIGPINMKGKYFIIDIPIFRQQIQVFYKCSYDLIRTNISEKLYRSLLDASSSSDATAISDPDELEYVVCFHEQYPDPGPGVIAHEFFHIVSDLCADVGIRLSTKDQEPVAYLLTYSLDAFYAALEDKLEGSEFKVKMIDDEE